MAQGVPRSKALNIDNLVLSHAVYKMMEGPSEAACRSSLQTTSRCYCGNMMVLSG